LACKVFAIKNTTLWIVCRDLVRVEIFFAKPAGLDLADLIGLACATRLSFAYFFIFRYYPNGK